MLVLIMRQRQQHRRAKAQDIRQNATQHVPEAREREAIAEESEARARQAKAEADAKAAEAKRLGEHARTHQEHAAESRHKVDSELARADEVDPDVGRDGTRRRTVDDPTGDQPPRHGHGTDQGYDPRQTQNDRPGQDPGGVSDSPRDRIPPEGR
nr:hypothetical protein [Gordonia sp. SID5947]